MSESEEATPLGAAVDQYRERMKAPASATTASSTNWSESSNAVRVLQEVPRATPERCPPGLLDAIRDAHKAELWPIYLTGRTGTGKSSAAAHCFRSILKAKAEAAVADQQWPRWIVWPDFCARMIAARMHGITVIHENGTPYTADESAWWNRWRTKRLVVVDEIGLRTANEVRQEAMWKLLEVRRGLPTILTGNLDAKEIRTAFDNRILSRILAGTWIVVNGEDQRVSDAGDRRHVIGQDS